MSRKLEDYTMADVGDAVKSVVADLMPEPKGKDEFTVGEFRAAVMAEMGIKLTYRQAQYRLSQMEQLHQVTRMKRLDLASGRELYCYARIPQTEVSCD